MNVQIPFDLLGDYESIVLNTDDSFYQLTVRYQGANITITLNKHEIESYDFKIAEPEGKRKVKEVLQSLIGYFEKLGYINVFRINEIQELH